MSFINKLLSYSLSCGILTVFAANAMAETPRIMFAGKNIENQAENKKDAKDAKDEGESAESSRPEAILFRIEDIKPLTNKDGFTDRCSFMLTVYNRSDHPLKTANLSLFWTDAVSGRYKIEDYKLRAVTGDAAKTKIESQLQIEGLAPHKQKSFEQTVTTDKCYLLLDSVEYHVGECTLEGNVTDKDGKAASCASLFNYINSKNPEYYSEFKDIPASVLAKQAEEEKQKELSNINEAVEKITKDMQAMEEDLKKIK